MKTLSEFESHPLSQTQGASYPFWSPDNRSIAFFAGGKLKAANIQSGVISVICDAPTGRGGAWNKENLIVFCPDIRSPLFKVDANGGVASQLTQLDLSRDVTHRWPVFSPDGKHIFYYSRRSGGGEDAIDVISIDGKERKQLIKGSTNFAFSNGYLLYMRETTLMAYRFDENSLTVKGDPFAVVNGIQYDVGYNRGVFTVSENGILIYRPGSLQYGWELIWVDRGGKRTKSLEQTGEYYNCRVSPDGKRIVLSLYDHQRRNRDIYIDDVERGIHSRFTFEIAYEDYPVWSPKGDQILFSSARKGVFDLVVKSSFGSASEEVLVESDLNKAATDWSRDGTVILYYTLDDRETKRDLWYVSLIGERTAKPFLRTPFNEYDARFSPDGRFVAYVSDESGKPEVYIRPFRGPETKLQISLAGGIFPRWRGDGKELFYWSVDGKLMVVDVVVEASIVRTNKPRSLFKTQIAGQNTFEDVSGDGQRFLLTAFQVDQSHVPLNLIVGWSEKR